MASNAAEINALQRDIEEAARSPSEANLTSLVVRAARCYHGSSQLDEVKELVSVARGRKETVEEVNNSAMSEDQKAAAQVVTTKSWLKGVSNVLEKLKQLVAPTPLSRLLEACALRFKEAPWLGRYMLDQSRSPYDYGPGLRMVKEGRELLGELLLGVAGYSPVGDKENREPPLPLFSGESGAGKTWEMLNLQPPNSVSFALRVDGEFGKALEGNPGAKLPGDDPERSNYVARRNQAVQNHIVQAVEAALRSRFAKPFHEVSQEPLPCELFVVVDEVGGYPQCLRALISGRNSICQALGRFFAKVSLVAGGTAVDAGEPDIGSYPGDWKLFRVQPVKTTFFSGFVERLDNAAKIPPTLVRTLRDSVPLKLLLPNRRLARAAAVIVGGWPESVLDSLMQYEQEGQTAALEDTARVQGNTLALLCIHAYRRMNALAAERIADLGDRSAQALFAVLFAGRPSREPFAEEIDMFRFVLTKGIVTSAVLCREISDPKNRDANPQSCVVRRTANHIVQSAEPAKQRGAFCVTVAQALMIQLRYGSGLTSPLGELDWRAFKSQVAAFAHALATALQTKPAFIPVHLRCGGVLSRFLNETLADKKLTFRFPVLIDPPPTGAPVSIVPLTGNIGVVRTIKNDPRGELDARYQEGQIYSFQPHLELPVPAERTSTAPLVLISREKSPFADVILVFPKQYIFLFQAEFYTVAQLDAAAVATELFKMGFAPETTLSQNERDTVVAGFQHRDEDTQRGAGGTGVQSPRPTAVPSGDKATAIPRGMTAPMQPPAAVPAQEESGQMFGVYCNEERQEAADARAAASTATRSPRKRSPGKTPRKEPQHFAVFVSSGEVSTSKSRKAEAHVTDVASYGVHVLRGLMQKYECPVAYPVMVTLRPVPSTLMAKFTMCDCPRDMTEMQAVPVLWWTAKDLYPFGTSSLASAELPPTGNDGREQNRAAPEGRSRAKRRRTGEGADSTSAGDDEVSTDALANEDKYLPGNDMSQTTLQAHIEAIDRVIGEVEDSRGIKFSRSICVVPPDAFIDRRVISDVALQSQRKHVALILRECWEGPSEIVFVPVWIGTGFPHYITVLIHRPTRKDTPPGLTYSESRIPDHDSLEATVKFIRAIAGTQLAVRGSGARMLMAGVPKACGPCVINDYIQLRLGRPLCNELAVKPNELASGAFRETVRRLADAKANDDLLNAAPTSAAPAAATESGTQPCTDEKQAPDLGQLHL